MEKLFSRLGLGFGPAQGKLLPRLIIFTINILFFISGIGVFFQPSAWGFVSPDVSLPIFHEFSC